MKRDFFPPVFAAFAALAALPAEAQDSSDVSARQETMRARPAESEARIGTIEDPEDSGTMVTTFAAPTERTGDDKLQGAAAPVKAEPVLVQSGGSSFTIKPRGRLQFDTNFVSRPDGTQAPTLGWSHDIRRAFLGVDGKIGGGFGYRFELDFAQGTQFTDVWLSYEHGPIDVTLGHHRLTTLEDLTSDLETTLLERAAFVLAFGFERRLGLSVAYTKGDVIVSAGIFSDDLETLGSDVADDSYSLDSRLVYMPKVGATQFHLGASLHHRELNDLTTTLRYRVRPGARTTEMRFVDTGAFSSTAETGYGLELAAIHGPVHAVAESYWQKVTRPGLADPTFFGAYGEIGYVFAGGKGRSYRNGAFGAIKPSVGVDKGGSGAWQINMRYDWLDLSSSGINGGKQRILGASIVWVPIENVKFLANYLRATVRDTPILIGSARNYTADVIGLRAQYGF